MGNQPLHRNYIRTLVLKTSKDFNVDGNLVNR
jgi:hypothetical protein